MQIWILNNRVFKPEDVNTYRFYCLFRWGNKGKPTCSGFVVVTEGIRSKINSIYLCEGVSCRRYWCGKRTFSQLLEHGLFSKLPRQTYMPPQKRTISFTAFDMTTVSPKSFLRITLNQCNTCTGRSERCESSGGYCIITPTVISSPHRAWGWNHNLRSLIICE